MAGELENRVMRKVAFRIVPFVILLYFVAYIDRVNIGFASLTMNKDLGLSATVFGFGAGIFFWGYFLFEVPSNIILDKVGARLWIARVMITWGIVSAAMAFVWDSTSFYVLRFLLGAAEAGFFPGIILYLTYWFPADRRARMVAWFMTAIAASNVIGAPFCGAIMQFMDGAAGWRGWQWLFFLEGAPSVVIGAVVLFALPDGPQSARWLTAQERDLIIVRVRADEAGKEALGRRHTLVHAFADARVWALALVYFCGTGCFYAVSFWMPTIIQELSAAGADYLRVGLISMIPWGTAAIAMVLWGIHSDRTGERRWHSALGLGAAMAGLLLLALIGHDPIAAIGALCLVTCGTLGWVVTFWSLPTAFLSGTAAAAGIALINSVGNLGGHFGPDLIGRIRTAMGGASEDAFLALAAAALLGALLTLLAPKAQATPARRA